MRCYCCSDKPYSGCCEPLLQLKEIPSTPEKLMRSRFSAYCTGNMEYVLNTYTQQERDALSLSELEASAKDMHYFALQIENIPQPDDQVSFRAFYFYRRKPGLLHETSHFVKEDNQWRYHSGVIHDDTGVTQIGRNEPCPCGRGKKFKQCCLLKAR